MIEENKTTYQQLLQCAEQKYHQKLPFVCYRLPQHPSVVVRWQEQPTLNVFDVKEAFVAKNPKMEFIIDNFGDNLDLFEIPLSEVTVTLENQEVHELKL